MRTAQVLTWGVVPTGSKTREETASARTASIFVAAAPPASTLAAPQASPSLGALQLVDEQDASWLDARHMPQTRTRKLDEANLGAAVQTQTPDAVSIQQVYNKMAKKGADRGEEQEVLLRREATPELMEQHLGNGKTKKFWCERHGVLHHIEFFTKSQLKVPARERCCKEDEDGGKQQWHQELAKSKAEGGDRELERITDEDFELLSSSMRPRRKSSMAFVKEILEDFIRASRARGLTYENMTNGIIKTAIEDGVPASMPPHPRPHRPLKLAASPSTGCKAANIKLEYGKSWCADYHVHDLNSWIEERMATVAEVEEADAKEETKSKNSGADKSKNSGAETNSNERSWLAERDIFTLEAFRTLVITKSDTRGAWRRLANDLGDLHKGVLEGPPPTIDDEGTETRSGFRAVLDDELDAETIMGNFSVTPDTFNRLVEQAQNAVVKHAFLDDNLVQSNERIVMAFITSPAGRHLGLTLDHIQRMWEQRLDGGEDLVSFVRMVLERFGMINPPGHCIVRADVNDGGMFEPFISIDFAERFIIGESYDYRAPLISPQGPAGPHAWLYHALHYPRAGAWGLLLPCKVKRVLAARA